MERWYKAGFNRIDILLGIAVLVVVAAGLPWLGRQLDEAKSARARDHAAQVAQAILDFHTEMGHWPAPDGKPVDLTMLTAVPPPGQVVGTMLPRENRPWIEQVPVDSWGRPFVAAVYGEQSRPEPRAPGNRAYPMAPPPGTTIVVVSAGHDGILQSDLDALARVATLNLSAVTAFGGDDTGQVLRGRENAAGS
jgi:hypothetical protein